MYKWCHESRRSYTFVKLKAKKISKQCDFVLVTWPWRLPEEWPEACGSWTVVGAGTMHVLALTQLGIWQSDWWRAGITSTNLHIVVEFWITHRDFVGELAENYLIKSWSSQTGKWNSRCAPPFAASQHLLLTIDNCPCWILGIYVR